MTYWNTKDGPEKSTMFQEVDEKDARQVVVNLKDELTYMFHVQAYVEFGDSIVLGPTSSVQSSPTGEHIGVKVDHFDHLNVM